LARPAVIPAFAALALLLFAALFIDTAVPPKPTLSGILPVSFLRFSEGIPAAIELRAWLSIHEKRDPSSITAVSA
jgi:hypothetical protein